MFIFHIHPPLFLPPKFAPQKSMQKKNYSPKLIICSQSPTVDPKMQCLFIATFPFLHTLKDCTELLKSGSTQIVISKSILSWTLLNTHSKLNTKFLQIKFYCILQPGEKRRRKADYPEAGQHSTQSWKHQKNSKQDKDSLWVIYFRHCVLLWQEITRPNKILGI